MNTLDFRASYRPDQGLFWAVQIVHGSKPASLPQWFRPIFEKGPAGTLGAAGLEPLRFRSGRFFFVEWVKAKGEHWPIAQETEIEIGDWIEVLPGGSVRHLLGQHRLQVA